MTIDLRKIKLKLEKLEERLEEKVHEKYKSKKKYRLRFPHHKTTPCIECGKIVGTRKANAHKLWLSKKGWLCGRCHAKDINKRKVHYYRTKGMALKCDKCGFRWLSQAKGISGATSCSNCGYNQVYDKEKHNKYYRELYWRKKKVEENGSKN